MASRSVCLAINIVGVNIGWFACVLAASHDLHVLAPTVVAGLFAVHVALHRPAKCEALLAGTAAVVGFGFDSVLMAAGVYEARRWLLPAPLATVWLVSLWINFALVLNVALRALQGRWILAAAIGAIGGPVAYLSAERLGAVTLASPWWYGLLPLALAWGLVVPALLRLARYLADRKVHAKERI